VTGTARRVPGGDRRSLRQAREAKTEDALHVGSEKQRRYGPLVLRPRLRVTSVSIAAPDPRELATFYSKLLGWPVTSTDPPRPDFPAQDGWAQMRPPDNVPGPTLNFEYEARYAAPVWPSTEGQQQLQTHLDIAVDDLAAAVAWAQHAGATLASYQPQDDVRVMLDPVGHPFCLFLAA